MITLTQMAVSTEPIQLQVQASADPTGDGVQIAFVKVLSPAAASPDPADADWHVGYWETDLNPTTWWASVLVGPANGGVPLTAGWYVVYVKVTDNPAVPVKPGCYLQIL